MTVSLRPFRSSDVQEVGEFLVRHYLPGNRDGNWLRPEWDYMHSHPNLDEDALDRIGVWEDGGKIVAVAHYEHQLGDAFFQVHPHYTYLRPDLLAYAEDRLYRVDDQGRKSLRIYIKEILPDLEQIARDRSYQPAKNQARPLSLLLAPPQPAEVQLPEGFRLISLAEENDLARIHRALWRGFDHAGEPPPAGIEWRRKMQSSSQFRKDLTLVVVEPGGEYVCFCGLWYEETNRYAYIEPLATDPDYRRQGLAGAAVREGVRRCARLGAQEIYVGSDQPFYLSLGFRVVFRTRSWTKELV